MSNTYHFKNITDQVENDSSVWIGIIEQFSNKSIYQTVEYAKVMGGSRAKTEYVIICKGSETVGACVIRLYSITPLGPGIAYGYRGPLYRTVTSEGKCFNSDEYCNVLRVLREEYVVRRGLYLRLFPYVQSDAQNIYGEAWYKDNGYIISNINNVYKTYAIDLTKDLESIISGMNKKWRYNLRKSQKGDLNIVAGDSVAMWDEFKQLYNEMHARKGFSGNLQINKYQELQQLFPLQCKMSLVIAYCNKLPVAGILWTAYGEVGVPVFSATSMKGRDMLASYATRWYVLCDLKAKGCRIMDQGGVDKKINPGGFAFKSKMGGSEIDLLGYLDASAGLLTNVIVRLAFVARAKLKKMR